MGPYLTYIVEFVSEKDVTSRVYFDSDSGYVIRAEDAYETADGPYTVRMDFADYRAIEGMKFPFRMRRSERGSVFFIRLTQLKNNVYIDDSVFLNPNPLLPGYNLEDGLFQFGYFAMRERAQRRTACTVYTIAGSNMR